MGSKSARRPTPAPQTPAPAAIESMKDTAREDIIKRKKRQYSLDETLSVFSDDSNNKGGLA